jgi:hypothetical protein
MFDCIYNNFLSRPLMRNMHFFLRLCNQADSAEEESLDMSLEERLLSSLEES